MDKRIITAAITGSIHTPSMSPYLPITPDQIVDEAVRACDAGAAVAHIHVRNPETGQPSADVNLFKEVAEKIKSRCNIVLCITTGGALGMTTEQRVEAMTILKPELASFNFGSFNFALFHVLESLKEFKFPWEQKFLASSEDAIFPNTFKSLREFSGFFNKYNVQPELEVYDTGQINNVAFMLKKGHLKRPIYIQFVLGILGGIQPTADNVLFLRKSARELIGDFTWSVCAAGRHQFNMCTLSLLMGGNVRVGLEDNLYIEKGVKARSNAEQVEKIIKIARELGIEPATPDEAREILKLKGLDKVDY
ncbi:MAG: 3-keto-5-aminohexanoate cleavage protein [Deltaproteobacteria bacterium]|nr:3-keto-5-aminohexanoate cleavage protein [Deltaproteobacteria bacterium]